jgi:hypothetical protein
MIIMNSIIRPDKILLVCFLRFSYYHYIKCFNLSQIQKDKGSSICSLANRDGSSQCLHTLAATTTTCCIWARAHTGAGTWLTINLYLQDIISAAQRLNF